MNEVSRTSKEKVPADPVDRIAQICDDAEGDKLTRIAAVLGYSGHEPPAAPAVVPTFSFDGEGIYQMYGMTGQYVLTEAYRDVYVALQATKAERDRWWNAAQDRASQPPTALPVELLNLLRERERLHDAFRLAENGGGPFWEEMGKFDAAHAAVVDWVNENAAELCSTAPPVAKCEWGYDAGDDVWHTGCGQMHVFMDRGPTDNDHKFCPYCGKGINDLSQSTATKEVRCACFESSDERGPFMDPSVCPLHGSSQGEPDGR